jgi:hypothetical protein
VKVFNRRLYGAPVLSEVIGNDLTFNLLLISPADGCENRNDIESFSITRAKHSVKEAVDLLAAEQSYNVHRWILNNRVCCQFRKTDVTIREADHEIRVLLRNSRVPTPYYFKHNLPL